MFPRRRCTRSCLPCNATATDSNMHGCAILHLLIYIATLKLILAMRNTISTKGCITGYYLCFEYINNKKSEACTRNKFCSELFPRKDRFSSLPSPILNNFILNLPKMVVVPVFPYFTSENPAFFSVKEFEKLNSKRVSLTGSFLFQLLFSLTKNCIHCTCWANTEILPMFFLRGF